MSSLRSALFLLVSAGSLRAQASAPIRPTTAQAGALLVPGADLVVDSIGLTILPFPGAGASADGERVSANGVYVVARVTNRGRERWASRGQVGFSLSAGREEEAAGRTPRRGGASVVEGSRSIISGVMAPFGPFSAQTTIPGSLAPGESKMIQAMVGNRNDQSRLIFERDKYYTVISTIRATGDMDESNNRSTRIGRFDAGRRGTLLVNWEPIEYRAISRGTVQVNAPPRP